MVVVVNYIADHSTIVVLCGVCGCWCLQICVSMCGGVWLYCCCVMVCLCVMKNDWCLYDDGLFVHWLLLVLL